jgi:MFS family permease
LGWNVLLLMACAGLGHFNRVSISVAGSERLMKDYDISETGMGAVYSAYLLAYTLCMIPGGAIIDRIGPRAALVGMGFGTALFALATGILGLGPAGMLFSLPILVVIRALAGAASVPLHPGAARFVSLSVPPRSQAFVNGMITGTALLGIAMTFTVFGWLIDSFGWPMAFVISGTATALLAAIFAISPHPAPLPALADAPRPACDIDQHRSEPQESTPWRLKLTSLLQNRSLVLLTLSYAAVGYFQYLVFYWGQHYFTNVLALGTDDGRFYATFPNLAMAVGMPLGGWLAGVLQARTRLGRGFVPAAGLLSSAVLVSAGVLVQNPVWVVSCFSLAMFAVGMSEGLFWTAAVELGGEDGGLSAAFFNTGGNAGGLLAPVVTPIFSSFFGWQGGFGLASAVCILGAVAWRWIDLRKSD